MARGSGPFYSWKQALLGWTRGTRPARGFSTQLSRTTILQDLIRSIRPPDQRIETAPFGPPSFQTRRHSQTIHGIHGQVNLRRRHHSRCQGPVTSATQPLRASSEDLAAKTLTQAVRRKSGVVQKPSPGFRLTSPPRRPTLITGSPGLIGCGSEPPRITFIALGRSANKVQVPEVEVPWWSRLGLTAAGGASKSASRATDAPTRRCGRSGRERDCLVFWGSI